METLRKRLDFVCSLGARSWYFGVILLVLVCFDSDTLRVGGILDLNPRGPLESGPSGM